VLERHATVLALIAAAVEPERFPAAAQALATEAAVRLGAERVTVGVRQGGALELVAVSHSARFNARTDLARDLQAAMNESLDQGDTLVYPLPDHRPARVTWAHAELARHHGAGGVVTVPLSRGGRPFGALTLEQPDGVPVGDATVEVLEVAAAVLGPVLDSKQRDDRPLLAKVRDAARETARGLVAARSPRAALALLAVAVAAYVALASGTLRVSAPARLEGAIQHAVVAPVTGYVASASARPGDVVHTGDVLVTLDDRDLRLQRAKWASRREQLTREYHGALASHERAKVAVLKAQIDQAGAELDLVEQQLERTHLVAPFDGVVVSGDLSQSLGAPVERGQTLMQVAPLDAYRVVLQVDERDAALVAEGQPGELVLAALPGDTYPVKVSAVTPVATAEDGRNTFRVEARLEAATGTVRPGMEGVARVEAGSARLLWIATRRLTEWLALWLWARWP
jgi:RND family efflux transporter MFP subunit